MGNNKSRFIHVAEIEREHSKRRETCIHTGTVKRWNTVKNVDAMANRIDSILGVGYPEKNVESSLRMGYSERSLQGMEYPEKNMDSNLAGESPDKGMGYTDKSLKEFRYHEKDIDSALDVRYPEPPLKGMGYPDRPWKVMGYQERPLKSVKSLGDLIFENSLKNPMQGPVKLRAASQRLVAIVNGSF